MSKQFTVYVEEIITRRRQIILTMPDNKETTDAENKIRLKIKDDIEACPELGGAVTSYGKQLQITACRDVGEKESA